MTKTIRSIFLYTLALTLPLAVVAQTSIADIQKTSDASGDSPKDGETVTISGIVTAEFWGSYKKRTFFVQDADSAWSGIMVYNNDGWDTFPSRGRTVLLPTRSREATVCLSPERSMNTITRLRS